MSRSIEIGGTALGATGVGALEQHDRLQVTAIEQFQGAAAKWVAEPRLGEWRIGEQDRTSRFGRWRILEEVELQMIAPLASDVARYHSAAGSGNDVDEGAIAGCALPDRSRRQDWQNVPDQCSGQARRRGPEIEIGPFRLRTASALVGIGTEYPIPPQLRAPLALPLGGRHGTLAERYADHWGRPPSCLPKL
jgi:hypothetical protein